MAKFSQGFLRGISDFGRMDPNEPRRRLAEAAPQYQQMGTTDPLARRVGSLFSNLGVDTSYMQTAPERIAAETQGLDLSTIEGQQKALQAEMQYVQDPQARRALGLRMIELNKLKIQQEELAIQKAQRAVQQDVTARVANQFEDPLMADSVKAGLVPVSTAMVKLTEKRKNERAMEGTKQQQLAYLTGLGVSSDSWLYKGISDGTLSNLSVTERGQAISSILEAEEIEGLLELPEMSERQDVKKLLENGLINVTAAKEMLRNKEPDLSYSNSKWMLVDGKRTYVADVTPSSGEKYFGKYNETSQQWERIDPSKAEKLPESKQIDYNKVGPSEIKLADLYLQRLGDKFTNISYDIQREVMLDTASLASQLMSEQNISQEQAMEEASNTIIEGVKSGDSWYSGLTYERPAKSSVRIEADDYINAATKGQ